MALKYDRFVGMEMCLDCEKVNMSVVQLCLTLRPHGLYSLPGSSVQGILKARILEWVAIPSPGDVPNPGIVTGSPALQGKSWLQYVLWVFS